MLLISGIQPNVAVDEPASDSHVPVDAAIPNEWIVGYCETIENCEL